FMCEAHLQDFWMKQVLTKEQMKEPDIITKLREDILKEDPLKLKGLSTSLKQEEEKLRTALLTQSKEKTDKATAIEGLPSTITTSATSASAVVKRGTIISL
ncbi:MAG: hypothetical protein ACI9IL_000715, partial [Rickettsiales bacterium]